MMTADRLIGLGGALKHSWKTNDFYIIYSGYILNYTEQICMKRNIKLVRVFLIETQMVLTRSLAGPAWRVDK